MPKRKPRLDQGVLVDILQRHTTLCGYEEAAIERGKDPAEDQSVQLLRRDFERRTAALSPAMLQEVERRLAERETRVGRIRWLQQRCEQLVADDAKDRAFLGISLSDPRPKVKALQDEIRALYAECTPEERAALDGGGMRVISIVSGFGPGSR